jgi:ubiquitin-protein ligase
LHGRKKQEISNFPPDINNLSTPPTMQKSEHNVIDTGLDSPVDNKKLSASTDINTLKINKNSHEEVIQPTQETVKTNINSSSIVITIDDISSISFQSQLPVSPTPSPVNPPQRALPPRMRRRFSDAELIRQRLDNFKLVKVKESRGNPGNPPDVYIIEYFVKGIEKVDGDNIMYRESHLAEFKLTSDYPRMSPKCRMLTPVFHPNIEPAVICIGDHWTAQESLLDLIIRVGEIITYQLYNVKSPLDGETAMWADLNKNIFPVDNRDLTQSE